MVGFIVIVAAADADAAPAGGVDLIQLGLIIQQDAAAGEIGGDEGIGDIVGGVPDEGGRRFADLGEIEGADIAGHTDGDAGIVIHQHRGEGDGQQGRLLHGVIVVIHEIDGILIDIGEELGADFFQLGLGIAGGGVGHITGIGLAEVTLAIHIGHQKRLVAARQTHHCFVDGGVAVGVQPHGAAHDIGGFDPAAG